MLAEGCQIVKEETQENLKFYNLLQEQYSILQAPFLGCFRSRGQPVHPPKTTRAQGKYDWRAPFGSLKFCSSATGTSPQQLVNGCLNTGLGMGFCVWMAKSPDPWVLTGAVDTNNNNMDINEKEVMASIP
jgi:hypothetical protein